jgi:hypothetical protein
MKIVDKTPYRSESGEIDILGRLQGTLKYGLTWYNRIQAQDVVIAILEKQLGNSYMLVRNNTLPNTEINLPLVLVGPPGVFLINVTHEHGVYSAKDDEWGTMVGERFLPARINQITRTLTFGRVLQVYLDRQGFKGMFAVESILMAADPGMHVESTRPAVRIVMSDALERFATSLGQGRVILNAVTANDIVQTLLVGRTARPAAEPVASPSTSDNVAEAGTSAFETYTPGEADSQGAGAFSSGPAAYLFDDQAPVEEAAPQIGGFESEKALESKTAARPAARKRKAKGGLTRNQWVILVAMILFWLCTMAGALIYIYIIYFANA